MGINRRTATTIDNYSVCFTNRESIPEAFQGPEKNEEDWHDDEEIRNKIELPLQLLAGDYLKDLTGYTFKTLPLQLQLNIKRARIQVSVLKRETEPMYRYEVFKRLNTTGVRLEEQEIRNCTVRMISPKFVDYLKKCSSLESFINAVGVEGDRMINAFLDELALRYFAFKNYTNKFQHDLAPFLTEYMEKVSDESVAFNFAIEMDLFKRTFEILSLAFPGEGGAFRGIASDGTCRGPFSPAIFEMVSIGVGKNIDFLETINNEERAERLRNLILEGKKQGFTGGGSNARSKVNGRISLGSSLLSH